MLTSPMCLSKPRTSKVIIAGLELKGVNRNRIVRYLASILAIWIGLGAKRASLSVDSPHCSSKARFVVEANLHSGFLKVARFWLCGHSSDDVYIGFSFKTTDD